MTVLRRSRMRRKSTGKHLALTERDIAIFRTLARYRYLRSTYLHAFVGGASEKRFKERLGDLFHEGYLDRPTEQWLFADARCLPVVHELGKGGASAVGGTTEVEAATWFRSGPHRQFEHTLMVCEVLASIELATRRRNGVRFIPWSEILAKAPEATRSAAVPFHIPVATETRGLIPDGLFGLEYTCSGKKTYRFFALEVDRGTMPLLRSNKNQTSYLGKITAYREVIERLLHKTHFGIPNLLVLTVTNSDARMREIIARLDNAGSDSAAFLFQSLNAPALTMPAPALLQEPWQRRNHPALNIGALS